MSEKKTGLTLITLTISYATTRKVLCYQKIARLCSPKLYAIKFPPVALLEAFVVAGIGVGGVGVVRQGVAVGVPRRMVSKLKASGKKFVRIRT